MQGPLLHGTINLVGHILILLKEVWGLGLLNLTTPHRVLLDDVWYFLVGPPPPPLIRIYFMEITLGIQGQHIHYHKMLCIHIKSVKNLYNSLQYKKLYIFKI
jgi:hypothetical protein